MVEKNLEKKDFFFLNFCSMLNLRVNLKSQNPTRFANFNLNQRNATRYQNNINSISKIIKKSRFSTTKSNVTFDSRKSRK
jgi:hypothetical protein